MKLLFILALGLLQSCNDDREQVRPDSHLMKYTDNKNGVTCYVVWNSHGISCLQLRVDKK